MVIRPLLAVGWGPAGARLVVHVYDPHIQGVDHEWPEATRETPVPPEEPLWVAEPPVAAAPRGLYDPFFVE